MGVNSIYGYAGQWLITLSDLLGDHRITFAGEIQDRIDEYAQLFLFYTNSKHRADLGVGGFYTRDYTLTGFSSDSVFHDVTTGGLLSVQYPFSMNARTGLDLYYSHVNRASARKHIRTIVTTQGDSLEESYTIRQSFDIVLPTLSAVFDNTLWGITGPVNGIRTYADITIAPPLPTIEASFIAGSVDFRKYFHIGKKFVLATRAGIGANLALSNDKPGRRYFLGGTENWLIFDINQSNYENNISNYFYSDFVLPFRGWRYFDLTGSKYAVGNIEFRFPFVKEISIVWPLPIEVRYINGVLFTDVGNAWDTNTHRSGLPIPSTLYGGIGFGMRVNLGMFVLRYDRAWKTDWVNYVKDPVTYFSLGADF
jgi:outer membrane protein assembly factor BamA